MLCYTISYGITSAKNISTFFLSRMTYDVYRLNIQTLYCERARVFNHNEKRLSYSREDDELTKTRDRRQLYINPPGSDDCENMEKTPTTTRCANNLHIVTCFARVLKCVCVTYSENFKFKISPSEIQYEI